MSDRDALEQEFGTGVVGRYAAVAAEDARQRLAARHYLRAAFSAAHYVVLTGDRAWSDEDHERMAGALLEDVSAGLHARDDLIAAWRAAYYVMLTRQRPWPPAELERLARTVETTLRGTGEWDSVSFAGRAADFFLLGGEPFWGKEELPRMLATVRQDFGLAITNRDEVMAADRLALYRVLLDSLDSWLY